MIFDCYCKASYLFKWVLKNSVEESNTASQSSIGLGLEAYQFFGFRNVEGE